MPRRVARGVRDMLLWLMLLMVWRFNPLHYGRHFD